MNLKRALKLGLCGAMAFTLFTINPVNAADNAPRATVTGGTIQGYIIDNVKIFKGIPYAATTAGENRWRAPQPVESWSGVKDCTKFGQIAVQREAQPFACWSDEYVDGGMTLDNGLMGEDCLSVNVWTPAEAGDKLPVLVYIHGGANMTGSADNDVYDGTEIAKKGVVYVSMNYRVGIFGFLAYKDKTGDEVTGNFAIQDQIAALKWVKDNIAKFGGDPDNVTIMGQSAGSINVQHLIASSAAAGLFNKAIALSFNSCKSTENVVTSLNDAENAANKAIGNYTIKELREMAPAEVLALDYTPNLVVENIEPTGTKFLPDAFADGTWNKVDIIWGGVQGDQFLFDSIIPTPGNLFEPSSYLSATDYENSVRKSFGGRYDELLKMYPAKNNSADTARQVNIDRMIANYNYAAGLKNDADKNYKTYLFYFDHVIPDTPERMRAYGAFHTSDVNYWLNHFTKVYPRNFTAYDYDLGETMSSYIVNFVKTGNPNGTNSSGKKLPHWRAFYPSGKISYMHLGDKVRYRTLDADKSHFWLSLY